MVDLEPKNVMLAFGLTLFAGLATGIGSALAFFAKRTNTKFLSVALGFSAGVMIYVSMIEIFIKAKDALCEEWGARWGYWATTGAFFVGIGVIGLIDKLVPSFENPHELHESREMEDPNKADQFKKLHRMGLFTALAIAIHNFPEGLATFVGGLQDTIFPRASRCRCRSIMRRAAGKKRSFIRFFRVCPSRWGH